MRKPQPATQRCLLLPLKMIAALRLISCPPAVRAKNQKKSTAKDPKRSAHRPLRAEKGEKEWLSEKAKSPENLPK